MIDEAERTARPSRRATSRSSTAGREPARAPVTSRHAAHDAPEMDRHRPPAAHVGANGARAFRHRNYRLFFGGQAVSLVGTWMQQVAQAWLVLPADGDPLWLGVVAAAQFLPVMVLGLFAGVLADALPKRQTLIVTQAIDDGPVARDPRGPGAHRPSSRSG